MINRQGIYDIAQICINGHMVNDYFSSRPQHNKKYCDICGSKTITSCENCQANIRGGYTTLHGISAPNKIRIPSFCIECGKPFLWTQEKVKVAKELANEMEGINSEEKKILADNIDDLIRESPRTELASTRFRKIMIKVGDVASKGFQDILIGIISETAKKIIWPNS